MRRTLKSASRKLDARTVAQAAIRAYVSGDLTTDRVAHRRLGMSLRKAAEDVVRLTTMHTAVGVIRKGPLLSSSDPHVARPAQIQACDARDRLAATPSPSSQAIGLPWGAGSQRAAIHFGSSSSARGVRVMT